MEPMAKLQKPMVAVPFLQISLLGEEQIAAEPAVFSSQQISIAWKH